VTTCYWNHLVFLVLLFHNVSMAMVSMTTAMPIQCLDICFRLAKTLVKEISKLDILWSSTVLFVS